MRIILPILATFPSVLLAFFAVTIGQFPDYAYAETAQKANLSIMREDKKIADFQIEIAESDDDKIRGLMFREQMPADHGMIFHYSPPQDANMWMKNTLIPLDMLFVGAKHTIVYIHHKALPHSLTPIGAGQPVTSVIEINGGEAKRRGIQVGDHIAINRSISQGTVQ